MSGQTTALPVPTPAGGLLNPGVPQTGGGLGLIRVMSPEAVTAMEQADAAQRERERQQARIEPAVDELAAFVRRQFDMMKRHRNSSSGWTDRMLAAMRMFNGEYESSKLQAIREFGGSEIYARIVSVKCRAASALLRDVYLNKGTRPWSIEPSPVPTMPEEVTAAAQKLIEAEISAATAGAQAGLVDPTTGQPITAPTEEEIAARMAILEKTIEDGIQAKAREEAKQAEDYLDDLLREGGFYKALAEFLADLPLFPFACIRGPIVYMVPSIRWVKDESTGKSKMKKEMIPRMHWRRVSPFDIWWSPGASSIEAANIIYRERKSRGEINALLDVPGYNTEAIRNVLTDYPNGYQESFDTADSPRAEQESREDPAMNESSMYDMLEFHGSVQGKMLREWGMSAKDVPDEVRDYSVQAWMIGRFVIKVQLSPSPRERPPFYITSYDKVPGTMVGNSVPDMLSDIQDVCNALLRGIVNNSSMSSGPQVVVDDDVVGTGEDTDKIWPWRIWRTRKPRFGGDKGVPVSFFQPPSTVQGLLVAYEKFTQIGDETSAIPRYVTGSERMGGAGRTASGLALLMGNASKMLQTVVSNIDIDIFEPMLQYLYEIVMLTDQTNKLKGDENIVVNGVQVAMQKETERQRQIEFLQATANPIDMGIMKKRGRAAVLREVADTLGMRGQRIVPNDDEIAREEKADAAAQAAMPPTVPGAPGAPGAPMMDALAREAQGSQTGGEQTGPTAIRGPRVNLSQQRPAPPGAG